MKSTELAVTFDALLIWGDGRALDADVELLDGVGGVDRHLVVRGVTVREAEVEVLDVQVQVRVDVLFIMRAGTRHQEISLCLDGKCMM